MGICQFNFKYEVLRVFLACLFQNEELKTVTLVDSIFRVFHMFFYNLLKVRQRLRKLENTVYFTKKNEESRYIGQCSKILDVYILITYSYNYV